MSSLAEHEALRHLAWSLEERARATDGYIHYLELALKDALHEARWEAEAIDNLMANATCLAGLHAGNLRPFAAELWEAWKRACGDTCDILRAVAERDGRPSATSQPAPTRRPEAA